MQISDPSCPGREEELAAFIDGGLSPDERASLVRHLDGCETCYQIYAETRRLLADMSEPAAAEDTGGVAEGVLLRPGVWRRPRWILPLAATVLVGVGLAMIFPRMSEPAGFDSASLTASFEERLAQVETDWTEPLWPTQRGEGVSQVEIEAVFRLGARVVDLDLALRTQDRAKGREIVTAVRELVEATSRPELARVYRDIGGQLGEGVAPIVLLDPVRSAESAIDARLDQPAYRLGKWVRAAHLAALCGDAGFFSRYGDTSRLAALHEGLRDPSVKEWQKIDALLQRPVDAASLNVLREQLASVLRRGRP